MDQICDVCNRLFADDDKVKAMVVGRFALLKANRTYALKTPLEDCLSMRHFSCQYPQGETESE